LTTSREALGRMSTEMERAPATADAVAPVQPTHVTAMEDALTAYSGWASSNTATEKAVPFDAVGCCTTAEKAIASDACRALEKVGSGLVRTSRGSRRVRAGVARAKEALEAYDERLREMLMAGRTVSAARVMGTVPTKATVICMSKPGDSAADVQVRARLGDDWATDTTVGAERTSLSRLINVTREAESEEKSELVELKRGKLAVTVILDEPSEGRTIWAKTVTTSPACTLGRPGVAKLSEPCCWMVGTGKQMSPLPA